MLGSWGILILGTLLESKSKNGKEEGQCLQSLYIYDLECSKYEKHQDNVI